MRAPLFALLALSACTTPTGGEPSLAPRAAEAIDPRLPVEGGAPAPADPALAAMLTGLVAEGRSAAAAFDAEAPVAERLAAASGAVGSESWIAAQQALSALEALRSPLARVLGELDEMASERVKAGTMTPGDLAAIEAAQAELGALNASQAERVAAIQSRLAG